MRRITGIGGVFFRAKDPKALGEWYRTHLGLDVQDWGPSTGALLPATSGAPIWSLTAADSAPFVINYRVEDLHRLLALLREEGCNVLETTEESAFGKFGWVVDPEGNKIELWEPPAEPTA